MRKGASTAIELESSENERIANQPIRVNVDTLEHLMTMVSELVLTRNQLLGISRRNEDSEFKVPLQRLSNVAAEPQEGLMKTRMQPISLDPRMAKLAGGVHRLDGQHTVVLDVDRRARDDDQTCTSRMILLP